MNKEVLKHYRLTKKEYQLIKKYLGAREPSRLELALFSALWSEHCSYKSSAIHLKKLFFKSSLVLSSLGENAGIIDLGRREKVAFKIESHNHPSQITPYHGASTGVGGILRDIFVMNARPLALGNYLCFGKPNAHRMERLVDEVVKGIGDYGNCIGIPMVIGRTNFHSSYNQNIIVNAFSLGYLGPEEEIITSRAQGEGYLLVYVGSRTGRDGIHGASMASEAFHSSKGENKKTCVQIGDPFYGKQLMEACLESMRKNHITACQDMGAAGLISSSFELISKSDLSMNLYLDKVPLRDSTMTAEDILLSESQERALLLVHPKQYPEVEKIFKKYKLCVCSIGELKKEKTVKIFWKGRCVVQIDPNYLTKKAPRYKRPYFAWKPIYQTKDLEKTTSLSSQKKDEASHLLALLSDIRGCDKSFIYRQYDNRVGANTVRACSFPFGVIRLPSSGRALGISLGGRPHIMRMDSKEGGKDCVFEPALQLALRGFTPLALTDGLNFGNPEKPEVMSSFVACIEGIATASQALEVPVVSGNVSLYNETGDSGASPTPAIGMVGLKENLSISRSGAFFKSDLEKIDSSLEVFLIQAPMLFSKGLEGEICGQQPAFYGNIDSKKSVDFIRFLLKTVEAMSPHSACVSGKMGLAYTLARLLIGGSAGMKIDIQEEDIFQERLYEAVVILNAKQSSFWKKSFKDYSAFKIKKIGKIIPESVFSLKNISLPLSEIEKAYKEGFNKAFPQLNS